MKAVSPKIIMHIDLDAFFAAVEEREHQEYSGKPIVVGADPKNGRGRGVVATCNYEARKSGIRSAMPISIAWKLNRNAIFLPINRPLYEQVSSEIMRILKDHADKLEQVGIDEAFLDITKRARDFDGAKNLAESIKREISAKEGLTCSIGIGPNKIVAKVASDFQKPNRITLVKAEDARSFLAPLPILKLRGIGPKTARRLNAVNVRTIDELASCDVTKLREMLGFSGVLLHQMAQGIGESELVEEWMPRSFSREHTFEEDTSDEKTILSTLDTLLESVL